MVSHPTESAVDSTVLLKPPCIQEPVQPPPASISFRHPGYDDAEGVLFTLPRLDVTTAEQAIAGVHHGTALLACQVIANNAFDGYLTTDRERQHRVSLPLDAILLNDDYWFAAGGDNVVYPVVPRFEEWQFPHTYMDSLSWDPILSPVELTAPAAPASLDRTMPVSAAAPSNVATSSDPRVLPLAPPPRPTPSRCILSQKPYGIHQAHIVPKAQSQWFQTNSMRRYGDPQLFIHSENNKVPMRHDLHQLWDANIYALVPKRGGRGFVVHVLQLPKSAISEFADDWHNTPLQKDALYHAGKAFLFAKFAQAVFMLLKPFVAFSAVPRRVATFEARADDDPRWPGETKIAWVSPSKLSSQYGGGGSRSASANAGSRKRSRSQMSAAADEDDDWYTRNVRARLWSSDLEASDDWYARNVLAEPAESDKDCEEGDDWYDTNVAGDEFDEERGRPRVRRRRHERNDHTVDTLPSLTDTSAVGDPEDLERSVVLAPATSAGPPLDASKGMVVDDGTSPTQDVIT
ncbi:unnamed protein product [Discula destructiva]